MSQPQAQAQQQAVFLQPMSMSRSPPFDHMGRARQEEEDDEDLRAQVRTVVTGKAASSASPKQGGQDGNNNKKKQRDEQAVAATEAALFHAAPEVDEGRKESKSKKNRNIKEDASNEAAAAATSFSNRSHPQTFYAVQGPDGQVKYVPVPSHAGAMQAQSAPAVPAPPMYIVPPQASARPASAPMPPNAAAAPPPPQGRLMQMNGRLVFVQEAPQVPHAPPSDQSYPVMSQHHPYMLASNQGNPYGAPVMILPGRHPEASVPGSMPSAAASSSSASHGYRPEMFGAPGQAVVFMTDPSQMASMGQHHPHHSSPSAPLPVAMRNAVAVAAPSPAKAKKNKSSRSSSSRRHHKHRYEDESDGEEDEEQQQGREDKSNKKRKDTKGDETAEGDHGGERKKKSKRGSKKRTGDSSPDEEPIIKKMKKTIKNKASCVLPDNLPEPGRTYTPEQQAKWEEMFLRLVLFKESHGHTRVPETYEDSKLVNWVGNQRKAMSRQQRGLPFSRFDKRRIAMLDSIGFEWARARAAIAGSYERRSWEDMYKKLCEFKKVYGHTRVPATLDQRLANWVRNQRTAMSRKQRGLPFRCLNQRRINLLNNIGFAWVAAKDGQPEVGDSAVAAGHARAGSRDDSGDDDDDDDDSSSASASGSDSSDSESTSSSRSG